MFDGDVMSADFWQQQEQELERQWLEANKQEFNKIFGVDNEHLPEVKQSAADASIKEAK